MGWRRSIEDECGGVAWVSEIMFEETRVGQ